MAKKISQLTQATEVKSEDVTVIVQDGETKKLPLNMMVTKQDIENKKVAGLAKLDEIEATYENDTYTPTITVKNKSSVKTGEGDEVDYSANVMDGHAKSAILKGRTLVNLMSFNSLSQGYINGSTGADLHSPNRTKIDEVINFSGTLSIKCYDDIQIRQIIKYKDKTFIEDNAITVNGAFARVVSDSSFDGIRVVFRKADESDFAPNETKAIIVNEDITGVDIPYFEGMQSVKMPVLTTTGKNLFDLSLMKQQPYVIESDTHSITIQNGGGRNVSEILGLKHKPNEQYAFTYERELISGQGYSLFTYVYTDGTQTSIQPNTINISDANKTIKHILLTYSDVGVNKLSNICLVKGANKDLIYEPYKSNILTVNEDVELRGIGDVQDTLDLLTGELTERIKKFDFLATDDGNWYYHKNENGYTSYYMTNQALTYKKLGICDKLPICSWTGDAENMNKECVWFNGATSWGVMIKSDKASTKQDFLNYLNDNVELLLISKTESIKTVDLMPSGTHPSTTPYCWKNGHIQLSSSGLLPSLEYSVVTSRAGQINQNATMIVKNDKRIFDLEILLAGGLVNTTYQALTLQNQVETGLSKVSLNSETEPDYLLYHMIMKLIEEKAYKLDDLTEKVSVFYLYEKLSDEQFETIYSALYPFVEDEIVEEPVVEELPEVVEDEVIM